MRIWIDLTNSPHVLVMRPVIEELRARGDEVLITARDFAQTLGLLERFLDWLGRRIPEDLSVLAWDDSPLCRLTNPPLSAMSRDVAAYGAQAARVLLDAVAGAPPTATASSVPELVDRGSLGRVVPAPR